MYIEDYYILKGNSFLVDKVIKKNFFCSISKLNLNLKLKIVQKKSKLIFIFLLILLTFLNSFIFKFQKSFILLITSCYEIFYFLSKFILTVLPFYTKNKTMFFSNIFSLNNLVYILKALPLFMEIEKIIELNKFYFRIINQIKLKLTINVIFLDLYHKESICHLFKLPLYIY
jgi:hypothetical protein